MNSRERIQAAITHHPVDRVPVDLGGTRQSRTAARAYGKLRTELGLDTRAPFEVFDLYQQLAEIENEVLDRFGSDCLPLNRPKVDFVNPVQLSCEGMDPATLHGEFRGRLGFWGGSCDSQGSLGNGTPEEVAAEVERNLDAFRPLDGGFVFASVHNIQANVPAENIVALFDAARRYGSNHP